MWLYRIPLCSCQLPPTPFYHRSLDLGMQRAAIEDVARLQVEAAPHDRGHAGERGPLHLAVLGAGLVMAGGREPDHDVAAHDRLGPGDVLGQLLIIDLALAVLRDPEVVLR